MSSYNLTDNVNESFEFSIGGVAYIMRYPLVEEMETLQRMAEELERDQKAGKETDEKEINAYMYKFITPKESESPSIEEIMKTQNIKVLQNFKMMFQTEFGLV